MGKKNKSLKVWLSDNWIALIPYVMFIILTAIMACINPGTLSMRWMANKSDAAFSLVLVAIGQTFVLLTGGFDLSVGGVICVTNSLAAVYMGDTVGGILMWAVICIVIGIGSGVCHDFHIRGGDRRNSPHRGLRRCDRNDRGSFCAQEHCGCSGIYGGLLLLVLAGTGCAADPGGCGQCLWNSAQEGRGGSMRIKKFCTKHSSVILTYIVAVLLLTFVSIMRPGYASMNNLKVLSVQAAVLGLTALGQTFVILTGGMDLSIPWMFTIASFMMAAMTKGSDAKLVYVIPIVLCVGILMGIFNGVGVSYVGIAPVIMTMASNIIFQGLLVGITGGMPGSGTPDFIKKVATGTVGGVSILFLFWLAVSAVAIVILIKTSFGRKLYAVGNSETVALFSGIHVKGIKVCAYAVCGFTAALAGIVYSGRLGQLYLGMGDEYQMQSVAAVAIGGVSLVGGSGSYAGTMAGVFILIILNGLLSAMNIEQSIQKIIYGIVLFLAVLLSSRKKTGKEA